MQQNKTIVLVVAFALVTLLCDSTDCGDFTGSTRQRKMLMIALESYMIALGFDANVTRKLVQQPTVVQLNQALLKQ